MVENEVEEEIFYLKQQKRSRSQMGRSLIGYQPEFLKAIFYYIFSTSFSCRNALQMSPVNILLHTVGKPIHRAFTQAQAHMLSTQSVFQHFAKLATAHKNGQSEHLVYRDHTAPCSNQISPPHPKMVPTWAMHLLTGSKTTHSSWTPSLLSL